MISQNLITKWISPFQASFVFLATDAWNLGWKKKSIWKANILTAIGRVRKSTDHCNKAPILLHIRAKTKRSYRTSFSDTPPWREEIPHFFSRVLEKCLLFVTVLSYRDKRIDWPQKVPFRLQSKCLNHSGRKVPHQWFPDRLNISA